MSVDSQPYLKEESILHTYLLGSVDFDAFLQLQRRLHYEVTGDRRRAILVFCEHPPLITVGRQGSRGHIRLESNDLRQRQWPVRWVHRGGGCILHGPGQLAMYPIIPLDHLRFGIAAYLQQLGETVAEVMRYFSVKGSVRQTEEGVWVDNRLIAAQGVSIRDWVTTFGVYINLHPLLEPYRWVITSIKEGAPMTSLERERRGRIRAALVRQRLLEHFQRHFGFTRVALFSDHPTLHAAMHRCQEIGVPAEISEPQGI